VEIPKRVPFNANDWYWFIGADQTRLWSSKAGAYVPVDDLTFLAWKATGALPTTTASEQELSETLAHYGLIGPVVLSSFVNTERDRRISVGFMFAGHLFQSDVASQKRINGAVTLAILAVGAGAQPGDLRWHGGLEDFAWLAADNAIVPMDAQTVIAFGKDAGSWEASHVFAARALKDMQPIPRDFTDNKYWP